MFRRADQHFGFGILVALTPLFRHSPNLEGPMVAEVVHHCQSDDDDYYYYYYCPDPSDPKPNQSLPKSNHHFAVDEAELVCLRVGSDPFDILGRSVLVVLETTFGYTNQNSIYRRRDDHLDSHIP